ncbi:MAG: alpha/beta fold hydrolase [Rhodanobacteraceae bacterium]
MSAHVILLHGIWMRGITLQPLARRLRADGFSVELFEYESVAGYPDRTLARLQACMRASTADEVHLVGHSLGGVLALKMIQEADNLPPGRVVCLGSPLRGSSAARGFAHWPGGRWMLGRSHEMLAGGLQTWDGRRSVGVIAGRLPLGLGFLFGGWAGPGDGTVTVAETELPGISDHRVIAASHTGLLFSSEAAALCSAFLQNGAFPRG